MKTLPILAFVFGLVSLAVAADVKKIAPVEAAELVADGKAVLVDVREASEWKESSVAAPAVLFAKSDFDGAQKKWKPFLEKNAGREIILYCRSGNRSGKIAEALMEKGWKVANAGGSKDWTAAGLPVCKLDEKK